ncbi:MAG: hypothetical protein HY074_15040 [Deltaproteobacteria bacterium]|nr:hypothetical protein [Deltaproteobacteria bacterium]
MGIDKLIQIAAALAVLTVSTGQLPRVLHAVRVAQAQLVYESRASPGFFGAFEKKRRLRVWVPGSAHRIDSF